MKTLLLCALLGAVPTISHAAAADEIAVVRADIRAMPERQLAWKVAIALNDVEAAKTLVKDPGFAATLKIDRWNGSILNGALTFERGEIARVIIEAAPQSSLGNPTQLVRLGRSDNLPALRALLALRGFNPNLRYGDGTVGNYGGNYGIARLPLLDAVMDGNLEGVRALLAHPEINVNARDKDGETALHNANYAAGNAGAITDVLLRDRRVNANAVNVKGETPLLVALGKTGAKAVAAKLAFHPRVNLNAKNRAGQTALDIALQAKSEGQIYGVFRLLATGKVRPTAAQQARIAELTTEYYPDTKPEARAAQLEWLHILATDDLKAARAQTKKPDFDPLLPLPDGTSLLLAALSAQNPALTTILLDGAKNRDYLNKGNLNFSLGQTANLPILKRFLAQPDFDPNNAVASDPLLLVAGEAGNLEGVRALLAHSKIDVNAPDAMGASALWAPIADTPNSATILALLLADARVDPNRTDELGNTALSELAYFGSPEVVKVLVADPRVDANLPNNRGETPLFKAASKSLANVQVLLESGRVKVGAKERAQIEAKKAEWSIGDSPVLSQAK